MKDLNPKELAFSVASIFATIALILLIPSILVTSTDIFTAFCVLFWVFCFICLGIGCSVPKAKAKPLATKLINGEHLQLFY